MMGIPASQRRILTKTENAIRQATLGWRLFWIYSVGLTAMRNCPQPSKCRSAGSLIRGCRRAGWPLAAKSRDGVRRSVSIIPTSDAE